MKKFVGFLAFFISISLLSQAQKSASDYFQEGLAKCQGNDFLGAVQSFNISIAMSPDNPVTY